MIEFCEQKNRAERQGGRWALSVLLGIVVLLPAMGAGDRRERLHGGRKQRTF